MLIKFKHKWVLGLLLSIHAFMEFLPAVIQSIEYRGSLLECVILIPEIILAISFFISNENTHRIIEAVSLFVGSALGIIAFIDGIDIYCLIYFVYMCLLAFVGITIILNKNKALRRIGVILALTFSMIMLCIPLLTNSYYYYYISDNYKLYLFLMKLGNYYCFGYVPLFAVVLDMLRVEKSAEKSAGISLNTDTINFKELLLFIEDEYRTGKISEDEYNAKREEILKQI